MIIVSLHKLCPKNDTEFLILIIKRTLETLCNRSKDHWSGTIKEKAHFCIFAGAIILVLTGLTDAGKQIWT